MKKIGYYFAKYWYAYLFALLALGAYEVLDMVSPRVTQSIIDDVIGKGEIDILPKLILALVVVGVGRAIVGYCKEFTFDRTSFKVASDIRKHLFKHVQGLSVDFFDKTNTGEIMARIKDDVDQVQCAFGFIGMLSIQVIVHTGLVLYCMFSLSPKLTIFPLIGMPLCGGLAIIMEKKLDKVYDSISEENAEMNTVAEENLAGVRVVKAFSREHHEINKFLSHNKKYYELNMKQSKVWIRYNPVFQMITKVLPIASILWGGLMVIKGEITLGTLGAFIEYCGNAVWPMEMLGWLSNEIARAFASKKKIGKVYAEKSNLSDIAHIVGADEAHDAEEEPVPEFRSLEFDHVSLTIGEKEIIKDVSFKLERGRMLGIMGATGSGKTSIINLILRLYDPTSGVIRLNGTDIKELPVSVVRRMTETVMQEVFLFSDTIAENVRFGRKDEVTQETIDNSLDMACAGEFVNKLEEKSETIIGERGVGLSGGQKQRISMARAIAKKAPILIMDDSTSALDMETEHAVQQNLKTLDDMTKIIIAHRISAVRYADEIIVIGDGSIIERGTHEQLMTQSGYYRKTYDAQYGEMLTA